ncbi:MAG: HAMP domain-containing sensor histidine kinase [Polyangiaceae bacterium]
MGSFVPRFIAELDDERARKHLELGVPSGYVVPGFYAVLAGVAQSQGSIPAAWWFFGLVSLKFVANTALLLALRARRWVLPLASINLLVDLFLLTSGVYLTGGLVSPFVTAYVVEIAVMATLTNLGVTITTASIIFTLHTAMVLSVYVGWLPAIPPPVLDPLQIHRGHVITFLSLIGILLGFSTVFVSMIVKQLRDGERELAQRNLELVEAGRAKSQFMANITHELRTPIYGIVGLADVVDAGVYGPVTDKQHQAMNDVQQSAQSLLQLIDTLLLLARSEASKLEVELSEVAPNELVESVIASTRWMLGRKHLDIGVEIQQPLPTMRTDRGKLVQILVNLLSNAIKFTPEGGVIVARAWHDGSTDQIVFEVQDSGVGIPSGELPRIFEAFRQVDGSISRTYGGAGLGLAMVRDLCELLGGDVSVESRVGQGSRFTVNLPRETVMPKAESTALAAE